ncbi:MAG: O-antigen ligase family protein [Sphingomonadales bacterium]
MKWIALTLFLALIPVLQSWLTTNNRNAPYVWALLGFLPILSEGLHIVIAPVSWAYWPGYVKGFEISAVESIACAVLLSRRKVPGGLPMKWLWIAYIFAVLLSTLFAPVPMAALFAAWQALRMLLVFAAVASIATDDRGPKAIISGMAIALAINAGYAIQQRLGGTLQAPGLFSHQNIAGMASHFVAFPALAMLLADKKYRMGLLAVAAAAVVAIAGASRGTIGLAAFGYAIVLGLSLLRKPTGRKTMILALGIVGLLAVSPLAIGSLDRRFEATKALQSDYDERAAFEKAAWAMWHDHPMGVGANQFVNIANVGGYWTNAGVAGVAGSRSAHVHNAYLLISAEMGFGGLIAFFATLLFPLILALRMAWRYKNDPRGDLMIGLSVAIAVVAMHSFFEWVVVTYTIQWLLAINMGLIAGVAVQMSQATKARKKIPATSQRTQNA